MNTKKLHIEFLRIVGLFLVIFNHTGNKGFFLFAEETEVPLYFLYMFASVGCKIAVPIYFMISGALLLPKEETVDVLIRRRVLRIVAVLFIVSIPYYLWLHLENEAGVEHFLEVIYSTNATTGLWYLYSYLGLLLMLPILRKLVRVLVERDYIYLLIGRIIIVGLIPFAEYLIWKGNVTINPAFSTMIFTADNFFYAVEGHYLENVMTSDRDNPRNRRMALLFAIVAIVLTCAMTHYRALVMGECNSEELQLFYNSLICIPAMSVYFILKGIFAKGSTRISGAIIAVGELIFGAYLFEKVGRQLTFGVYVISLPYIGSFLASVLWSLAAMAISVVVVGILKRIPYLGRLVSELI